MQALMKIVSTEETRYYLGGIYIQPHEEGGAVMTATDGHLLVSVYDPDAHCAGASQIWRIKEFAAEIKAKESKSKNFTSKWLRYEQHGKETAPEFRLAFHAGTKLTAQEVAELEWDSPNCEQIGRNAAIDGTFPDFSRLFKKIGEERSGAVFSSSLLQRIGQFAEILGETKGAGINIEICDNSGPAHFRTSFGNVDAVGLLMPMSRPRSFSHPNWLAYHLKRPDLAAPPPAEMPGKSKAA
jgi:hypothetical protein